jgi:C-terminal processing protease CtpA/Prc
VSETTPFSKATQGNPDNPNPGEFIFSSAYKIPESKESYNGKLIVIVNEETASNAEYTAMAFRAGKQTIIVGSQTGGYDGNVSEIILPGGLKTRISGNGIYYPDDQETQRVGIVPDIEIKPTIKGIH